MAVKVWAVKATYGSRPWTATADAADPGAYIVFRMPGEIVYGIGDRGATMSAPNQAACFKTRRELSEAAKLNGCELLPGSIKR